MLRHACQTQSCVVRRKRWCEDAAGGRLTAFLVVLVAWLGVSASTGRASEPSAAQQAADALMAELPLARLSTMGPHLTRVFGQPLAFGTTPQESAERFVLGHAAVFGVEPGDLKPLGLNGNTSGAQQVMYDPETGEYKFTLVRYVQYAQGIPVFRSDLRLLVRNEADFPLVLAASSLRNLGGFVPPAAPLPFDPARPAATGMEAFTEPETVIWAGVEDTLVDPVPAATFVGQRGSPEGGDYEKWLFVVDRATGEVLYRENQILFTDVVGNVHGLATQGPRPDFCAAEVSTPMPWASVSIQGGGSAFADASGGFVIPEPGTSAVTVESPLTGRYFTVADANGPDQVLMQSVVPPGPADFLHNAPNTHELVRARVNAYLQANIARDFVLTYNPSYPAIAIETDFVVRVNRTDRSCPGAAWYDVTSLNFCRALGSFPNTAWSNVVHHEYGHHVVRRGGSGQGTYGEGMSDCIAILIADDPTFAYGFFGDCGTGFRTADNDYQYPCTGGSHDCGQLLSGSLWSVRNELELTDPGTYLDVVSSLTVNSILLHSGSQVTPQIAVDFLTLDDDDASIGNGTPHRSQICAGFDAHSMFCPDLDSGLGVSPRSDFGSEGPRGGPFAPQSLVYTLANLGDYQIDYSVTPSASWVSVTAETGTLAPQGSTTVTVSINGGADDLPRGNHPATLGFVNTTDHLGDITKDVLLTVGVPAVVYEWTLDTDPGWAGQGLWAWGQPTGSGGAHGGPDPGSAYTGTNVYGYNLNGDYERALSETNLTSTPIDCTELSNVTLRFRRWLGVEQPIFDHAYVRVSNDGNEWRSVWQNRDEVADTSWTLHELDISSVADHQPTVYLRWTMGVTDAGWQYCGWNIDDIQIVAIDEAARIRRGDFDDDSDVDLLDFAAFQRCFGESARAGCSAGDLAAAKGLIDLNDFAIFARLLRGPDWRPAWQPSPPPEAPATIEAVTDPVGQGPHRLCR